MRENCNSSAWLKPKEVFVIAHETPISATHFRFVAPLRVTPEQRQIPGVAGGRLAVH